MRKGITGMAAGFIAGTVLAASAAFAIGIASPAVVDRSAGATAMSVESTGSPVIVRTMNTSSSVDATRTDSGHMTIPQAQAAQHEAERRAAAAHMAAEAQAADHVAPAPMRVRTTEAAHQGDVTGGTLCAPTTMPVEEPQREQMGMGGHDAVSNYGEMGHQ